jgi:hypothetical protein
MMNSVTEEKLDDNKWARFLGAEKTTSGREDQSAQRLKRFAYATLFLMALAAVISLRTDVTNYISSFKSLRGLRLDITDLKVVDDENPRVRIRFEVKNKSPLEIEIEGYWFDLYLDSETLGRSYSMYRGTDPTVDPGVYAKAQAIEKSLGPGKTLDLEFTLYIYPAKMETVRKIRPTGPATWGVRSSFTVFLPYSRNKSQARLKAEYKG